MTISDSTPKLCACGCGGAAAPGRRFIHGHASRRNVWPGWIAGEVIENGRILTRFSGDHPRKRSGGYVARATLVLERSLGRLLAPGEFPHHINRDRTDDRPENLCLMTRQHHARLHNTEDDVSGRGFTCGTENLNAKLTENDVREILRLRGIMTQRAIAKRFGVVKSVVFAIHHNQIWKHVSRPEETVP